MHCIIQRSPEFSCLTYTYYTNISKCIFDIRALQGALCQPPENNLQKATHAENQPPYLKTFQIWWKWCDIRLSPLFHLSKSINKTFGQSCIIEKESKCLGISECVTPVCYLSEVLVQPLVYSNCLNNPRTRHTYVVRLVKQKYKTQNVVSCILLKVWRKCLFYVMFGNAINTIIRKAEYILKIYVCI